MTFANRGVGGKAYLSMSSHDVQASLSGTGDINKGSFLLNLVANRSN